MASQQQQKRIFVTGASGYVGSVVTELAVADGYTVAGLSRTETSDAHLSKLGAIPIRGDLTSLDVVRQECSKADMVIHLASAFVFGGPPFEEVMHIDVAVLDTMIESLAGTNKALVTTGGTLIVAADPSGAETNESSPLDPNPINARGDIERQALAAAKKGVRVTALRLAPWVYGRGGSGLKLFMGMAAQNGNVMSVDGSKARTTVVHVDDAARLAISMAEKGKAGEVYNASSATNITIAEMLAAMAKVLNVPVRDIPFAEAQAQMGEFGARFLTAENRASGAKAMKDFGWKPTGVDVLTDISQGSYLTVAKSLSKS